MSGRPPLHSDTHPGDGPPVLFVHGFLSSRAHWLPNLEALRTICTPVVVELYGHGRSPVAAEPTPLAYVEEFERLRTSHGVERWATVGHSLGGALTLRYALEHPDRTTGTVFTNGGAVLADERTVRQMEAGAAEPADRAEEAGRAFLDEHPMHLRHARGLPPDVGDELLADYELLAPAGVVALMRHTAPTASVRTRVHELSVPTLLTVGVLEKAFAEPHRFAVATIPGLEVVELPGGHNVNLHDVDGWNAAVCDFLRRSGR